MSGPPIFQLLGSGDRSPDGELWWGGRFQERQDTPKYKRTVSTMHGEREGDSHMGWFSHLVLVAGAKSWQVHNSASAWTG